MTKWQRNRKLEMGVGVGVITLAGLGFINEIFFRPSGPSAIGMTGVILAFLIGVALLYGTEPKVGEWLKTGQKEPS